MAETVEARAVKIAAQLFVAGGICKYESVTKCRHVYVDAITCENCIRRFLLSKARKELKSKNCVQP